MKMLLSPTRRDILKAAALTPSLAVPSLTAQKTPAEPDEISPEVMRRTEWFYKAKWGIMIDLLGHPGVSPEEWNQRINDVNVDKLVSQLLSLNAGYLFLTTGQSSGHYLAPNSVYDHFIGENPSKCSKRDLMLDLGKALRKVNIRLIAYFPSDAPMGDRIATWKLQYKRGYHPNVEYREMWQKIVQCYSDNWKTAVSGWWFDGCYWPNIMYRGKAPNFETLAAAARHGNPDSIVAFNNGVYYPVLALTPFEDYTAGETNDPSLQTCPGRWLDGENCHMLSYLGPGWTLGPPRFTDEQAIKYTLDFISRGGNVTWDAQIGYDGSIRDTAMAQLQRIGAAVAKINR